MKEDYSRTKLACYLGFVTQAICCNFAPLLYLIFYRDYCISLGNIALISTIFFLMQIAVDIFCAKFVDKIGYRPCAVASALCASLGLICLSILPDMLGNPFVGILISVFIYAVGSGLIEVVGSPIVEACPFDNKESMMSLLHSFYCWGVVATIIISSVFLGVFGDHRWKILACLFAIIPAVNIYFFSTCPIKMLVEDGKGMSIGELFKQPIFLVALVLMASSGACELGIAQWASAYVESALGFSKVAGDLFGPCLFAVTMGICRVFYGKYGEKIDLLKFMVGAGILCLVCYLAVAFFKNPYICLVGCILCGLSVGIMWPGTLSITSGRFPAGGTALFALLAMAGDAGGSIAPGLIGRIAQAAGDNIQVGMRVGLFFPTILIIMLVVFNRLRRDKCITS